MSNALSAFPWLGEVNLTGADLSRADLSGADLFKANMNGANLGKVYLLGTDLDEAGLGEAVMPDGEKHK